MNWFMEYIGVRGVLAIITITTFSYMMATSIEVSGEFYAVIGLVLGYYFSTQTQTAILKSSNGGNKADGKR